jgi:hypothetical protein
MHPTLPDGFIFDVFANVEQLLVFNEHIVTELTDIYNAPNKASASICYGLALVLIKCM